MPDIPPGAGIFDPNLVVPGVPSINMSIPNPFFPMYWKDKWIKILLFPRYLLKFLIDKKKLEVLLYVWNRSESRGVSLTIT
jgi:hypothetical protein